MTDTDKKLLRILQKGIPISAKPWKTVAEQAGITESDVLEKVASWLDEGLIRKIGAFVNHRISGYPANGMAVFDIPKEQAAETGNRIAQRETVSHCYERPWLPRWPYRLYAMVHGKTRDAVIAEVNNIARNEGITGYRILFSTREFKKSGSRLFMEDNS
ncbi:MAG: Lrp/AsnC family transcriptional regulator [Chitinivibrionales bacterium]|nr:Lrp/AsnC family transcriptional regulator [Chitinivibrionales bacterium]